MCRGCENYKPAASALDQNSESDARDAMKYHVPTCNNKPSGAVKYKGMSVTKKSNSDALEKIIEVYENIMCTLTHPRPMRYFDSVEGTTLLCIDWMDIKRSMDGTAMYDVDAKAAPNYETNRRDLENIINARVNIENGVITPHYDKEEFIKTVLGIVNNIINELRQNDTVKET